MTAENKELRFEVSADRFQEATQMIEQRVRLATFVLPEEVPYQPGQVLNVAIHSPSQEQTFNLEVISSDSGEVKRLCDWPIANLLIAGIRNDDRAVAYLRQKYPKAPIALYDEVAKGTEVGFVAFLPKTIAEKHPILRKRSIEFLVGIPELRPYFFPVFYYWLAVRQPLALHEYVLEVDRLGLLDPGQQSAMLDNALDFTTGPFINPSWRELMKLRVIQGSDQRVVKRVTINQER